MRKLLALGAAVLPLLATADDYVQVSLASYHLDRTRHYNERNIGVGLEHDVSEHVSLLVGGYRNSYHKTTAYAGVGLGLALTDSLRAGVVAGVGTGYRYPVLGFARVSYRPHELFTIDAIAAPPAEKNGSAMVGLAIRFTLN